MPRMYKLVGTNDDQDSCCCCGRSGLKRVMWLVPLDEDGNPAGEPEHYGTSCAAKMLGWANHTSMKEVNQKAHEATELTIRQAVHKILAAHCVVFNGMFFVLKTDVEALNSGVITPSQAVTRLRKAHPITSYYDGMMNRNKALSLALRG
jgi:hypothetical protein